LAELQKDQITRGDFLGFGLLGAVTGAILTIPPVAFILTPIIKTDVLGNSDVSENWFEVGHVSEITVEAPKDFDVFFPITQSYGSNVRNAVWLSWKDHEPPSFLEGLKKGDSITQSQIEEVNEKINVLSNSCAHLGCPVRWVITEGKGEFLCPCHGGIYDINGTYVAGPPPRDMYSYTYEVREDGHVYVKHEFDVQPGIPGISTQEPYVI
jgi:menaquinol-cytochrome c reductase iron-sulfur subunit